MNNKTNSFVSLSVSTTQFNSQQMHLPYILTKLLRIWATKKSKKKSVTLELGTLLCLKITQVLYFVDKVDN